MNRPVDDDLEAILDALGEVRFRFWVCPIEEHRRRNDGKGWPVVTVEWRDGTAYCTADGCDKTSAPATEETP